MKATVVRKYAIKLLREEEYIGAAYKAENPESVYRYARDEIKMHEEPVEQLVVIALDTKSEFIGYSVISRGSIDSTMAEPRNVFQFLLSCNAASAFLLHNHPSGQATPSRADVEMTKRIVEAGEILGIKIVDHIIVGDGYTSLRQKGLM
jgi:DNA repair protein RadC